MYKEKNHNRKKKRLFELMEQIHIAFASYQTYTALVGKHCKSQNR